MKNFHKGYYLIIFCFVFIFSLSSKAQLSENLNKEAKLILPNVISDNMVLQQNSKVKFWGKYVPDSEIKVLTEWDKNIQKVKSDSHGNWDLLIRTTHAGGPYSIKIKGDKDSVQLKNILLGEVWICAGQSNMEMPIRGFGKQHIANAEKIISQAVNYNDVRVFTAKKTISERKEFNVKGKWTIVSPLTVKDITAVGYLFAEKLHDSLKVPIGMIHLSWGGANVQAWSSYEVLKMFPEIDLAMDMNSKSPQRIPTALYNGMFYPIHKYTVKGIIWYQGENNIREPQLYLKLFPVMVSDWRRQLGRSDLPFYFVQIAPFAYDGDLRTTSAFLREVQSECQKIIPYSGMALTIDVGSDVTIHPPDKETVAIRLANWALGKTYGFQGINYLNPSYQNDTIIQNKIEVRFKNVKDKLVFKENSGKNNFEISGDDGVFFPASIKLVGKDRIEVWNKYVTHPVYIRYGFKNYVKGNLFDKNGLPVAPFRTDTYTE